MHSLGCFVLRSLQEYAAIVLCAAGGGGEGGGGTWDDDGTRHKTR